MARSGTAAVNGRIDETRPHKRRPRRHEMANSTRSAGEIVAGYCALTHKLVLHVIDDLDDAALRERPGRANPIAFDLWHIARWADWLQAEISTTRGEDVRSIWEREDLPARWRWDGAKLGAFQMGMGMDEGVSAQLPLPEKSEIERYAREC